MKAIKAEELIKELEKELFDYCLLLPIIKSKDGIESVECYVSNKSTNDFICYIRYFDGSETLDIRWRQDETQEILEQIKSMKNKGCFSNGCFVALYESNKLIDELLKLYKIDNFEYIESYHSTIGEGKIPENNRMKFLEKGSQHILDDDFINQSGNHIKVIERELMSDPVNNKIIYMIMEEKIIGYIALKRQCESIWDVAYIFVDEKYRNHGYATILCCKAILSLRSSGEYLYYSYCENEASMAVAKKSGLISCAKRYVFKII